MSIFVHISDRPIAQLTIVDDAAGLFRTISATRIGTRIELNTNRTYIYALILPERKCSTREFIGFDAFHLTFANRTNVQ